MPVLPGTEKIGDWNVTQLTKWVTDWMRTHPLPSVQGFQTDNLQAYGSASAPTLSNKVDATDNIATTSFVWNVFQMLSYNVKAYGAIGNGSADDTKAIQRSIDACAAAGGGIVYFPPGTYLTTASLLAGAKIHLLGSTGLSNTSNQASIISCTAAVPVLDYTGAGRSDCTVESLKFTGINSSGSKGVHTTNCSGWCIKHCVFSNFGDQGIHFDGTNHGASWWIEDVVTNNCLLVKTGRTGYVGTIQIDANCTDGFIGPSVVAGSNSSANDTGNGWIAAVVIGGSSNAIYDSICQVSETGLVLLTGALDNRVVNVRSDTHQTNHFVIGGNRSLIVGNMAVQNTSLAADNAFDAFRFDDAQNIVVGNTVAGLAFAHMFRYGFNDQSISTIENKFLGNFVHPGLVRSGAYNFGTSGASTGEPDVSGFNVLTYGSTVATDARAAKTYKLTVTNTTAFTISPPTFPRSGQTITYDILNSSGGTMGAITWNGVFKLAGAFVNPASTKRRTITFYYDGTNWVEVNRAAADI